MAFADFLHKLFKTDVRKQNVWDITVSELVDMGVKAVTVDADNTTSYDGTIEPLPFSYDWISEVQNAGIRVLLLSNAKEERASQLANQYGIPVIGMALKPLPFGYLRAALKLRLAPSKICMVGDQLFTDILGANLSGFKSIYVYPYKPEERNVLSYRLRRLAEKLIFEYQDKKYGGNKVHSFEN